MKYIPLKELAVIERDGVPPERIVSGTRYLGLEHIETGGRIISSASVDAGDLASTKFHFGPDHLLYGKLRPYLAKIALPNFAGVCSTDILPVRPSDELDKRYLAYFLRQPSMVDFASARSTGANLPRLSPKVLGEFQIPWCPLPEQQRIATILDQADALRRLRRRYLDRLGNLKQALFYDMFGDPVVNPRGWKLGKIRDLVAEAKYGTSIKANTVGAGLPILRMGNITYDGRLDLSDLKYVKLSEKESPKYTTRRGDLLFNRTNSKELVGKTTVVSLDNQMAIAGYLVRVRTNEAGDPYYISAYLNSAPGKAVLRNMCKNIVGMANINAQEFQDIAIAVPPITLQKEFAERLSMIEGQSVEFEKAVNSTNQLFASLQHRAFRGEL